MTTAPFDVTLSVSLYRPVGSLALFGAVGPLVATATQFSGESTQFKTIGAVSLGSIFFLEITRNIMTNKS